MEPRFSNSDLSLNLNGCSANEGEGKGPDTSMPENSQQKIGHSSTHTSLARLAWGLCIFVWFLSSSSASPSPLVIKRPLRSLCERQPGPASPSGAGLHLLQILDMQSEDTLGEKCVTGVSGPVRQMIAKLEELRRSEDKWESCSGAETWWLLSRSEYFSSCSWECPGSGRKYREVCHFPHKGTPQNTLIEVTFSVSLEGAKASY